MLTTTYQQYELLSEAEDYSEEDDDVQDDDGVQEVEDDTFDPRTYVTQEDSAPAVKDEEVSTVNTKTLLEFDSRDTSQYAKYNGFVAALLRFNSNLLAICYQLSDTDGIKSLDDKRYTSILSSLASDKDIIRNYSVNGVSVITDIMDQGSRASGIKKALSGKTKTGTVVAPKSYADVYNYLILYGKSNKKAFLDKAKEYFKDLEAVLSASVNDHSQNRFGIWLSQVRIKQLRAIITMFNYNVLDVIYDDKVVKRVDSTFDVVVGEVQAIYAYRMMAPDPITDNNGSIITQKAIRIKMAGIYGKFFAIKGIDAVLAKNKISVPDSAILSKLKTGKVLFHDPAFISTRRSFMDGVNLIVKMHHDIDSDNSRKIVSTLSEYKKEDSALRTTLKSIYDTAIKAYFRSHESPSKTVDYKEIYTSILKNTNVDDMFGPKPYSGTITPSTIKIGSPNPTDNTGFHGRINQFGHYYTALVKDKDGVYHGEHIINTPHLAATTKVRMNPNYDYIIDKGYVYETTNADTGTKNRITTFYHDGREKQKRFKELNKDFFATQDTSGKLQETPFRAKWQKIIQLFFGPKHHGVPGSMPDMSYLSKYTLDKYKSMMQQVIRSMAIELIYLTAMRVSHNDAATDGKTTYGATTLQRKHAQFHLVSGSGGKKQVTGVLIEFPAKGNVHASYKLGAFTSATDVSTSNKYSITDVSQLQIAQPINGDAHLPIFLYVLYVLWRFTYDYNPVVQKWVAKTSPADRIFSYNWLGSGRGAHRNATFSDAEITFFMKKVLNMGTSAHDIRRYRGTFIASKYLFELPGIGSVPNPLLNKAEHDVDPITNKPRTEANKTKLINQYCDEVGKIVAAQLGHYRSTTAAGTPALVNAATSVNNYISPVVFAKYFTNLGYKTLPKWLSNVMAKFSGKEG